MKHLIDKDALVAKIEKLKAETLQKKSQCKRSGLGKIVHQIGAYNNILSILATLEVKEVELEKNSLTWKDISATRRIMAECRRQMSNETQILNDEELCKEVLKRFKAQKGE